MERFTDTAPSPPRAVVIASLARLRAHRDELAKKYLLRLIERTSLDEIHALPIERVSRELPRLIGDVLEVATQDTVPPDLATDLRLHAGFLVELRAQASDPVGSLMADCTALQGVLIEALAASSSEVPELLPAAVAALADACAQLQTAVVDTYLQHHARELERQALTDPLTGLWNVRYMRRQLQYLVDLYHRYEQPFAVLVLDINGLKQVNDSYGHQVGDRALAQVALALRRSVRVVDTAARIGGDEFCVLAPNQVSSAGAVLAERLTAAIAREVTDPEPGLLSASIGVASCPEHGTQADALLAAADQAMYEAKAAGEPVAVASASAGDEALPASDRAPEGPAPRGRPAARSGRDTAPGDGQEGGKDGPESPGGPRPARPRR
ncbi:GGDEF domain-containing protein [Thermoleophilum album]|uniref:GGDEF domain-containing protein n=1 Tax=Thermoleophilum album TaxID=29539 RepID=UPI00237C65D5|nr:diguanylate cyclase [Thermoleophilum album]WDT94036.1 GGDEF domain-containing protein [Thermoleophilum album]